MRLLALETNLIFPKQIGLINDLMVPSIKHNFTQRISVNGYINILVHLADLLLLYETVFIRCDITTIQFLYTVFSTRELTPLLLNKRIQFYYPLSDLSYTQPILSQESKPIDFFSSLRQRLDILEMLFEDSPRNIVSQIEANVIESKTKAEVWEEFHSHLMKLYLEATYDIGYPFIGRDLEVGFRIGLGKIIDAWSTNTFNLNLDWEMLWQLDICSREKEPGKPIPPTLVESVQSDALDKLHCMNNLPTVSNLLWSEQWNKEDLLRVIMSDESANLREWLQKHAKPGTDVKDTYYQTLGQLPSKSEWTNWLRFGFNTTLSSGLGLIMSGNPALAAIIGIALGVTDTALGQKVVSQLSDSYHPVQWVSFLQKKLVSSN
jgi:hypothetical protein